MNVRQTFIYLRLEPYEGKLSSTVLRRERRGNPPDLADDDAFLSLQAVEEPGYKTADKTYPHKGTYRVNGFPKDAFHIACIAHKTRLQNILRTPGLDTIEKSLIKQRFVNMGAAQNRYIEQQKKGLTV